MTRALITQLADALEEFEVPSYPGRNLKVAQAAIAAREWLAAPEQSFAEGPWTEDELKAIVVIATSRKVSVSEVQRKLCISYNTSQKLCQSIVDSGFSDGMPIAPSLNRPAPEQSEPVMHVSDIGNGIETMTSHKFGELWTPLYTHPAPQPTEPADDDLTIAYLHGYHKGKKDAQPTELTDEEIFSIAIRCNLRDGHDFHDLQDFARSVLAAQRSKA